MLVSFLFLCFREHSTQVPAKSCILRLNQRKEVGEMNSMLPQRSAVATLGYGSGNITLKKMFQLTAEGKHYRRRLSMFLLIFYCTSNLLLKQS